MALVECKDCGGKLSTEAAACPHCGRPTKSQPPAAGVSPAEPARRSGLRIGFITVLALAFGFVCVLLNQVPLGTSRVPQRPTVTDAPSPALEPQLRVEKWSWGKKYGFAIAEGQLTNISDIPLDNVMAVVTFLDKEGRFITSDDALIDYRPILPGQKSPWKVSAAWNPAMKQAYVEFKALGGGTLRVEQR